MSQDVTKGDAARVTYKSLEIQRNNLLEIAPMAVRTLRLALGAKSERVRVDAAKVILSAVGLSQPPESHRKGSETLADVSVSDLRRLADKLEGELASRAKIIDPLRPNLAHLDAETIEESDA